MRSGGVRALDGDVSEDADALGLQLGIGMAELASLIPKRSRIDDTDSRLRGHQIILSLVAAGVTYFVRRYQKPACWSSSSFNAFLRLAGGMPVLLKYLMT